MENGKFRPAPDNADLESERPAKKSKVEAEVSPDFDEEGEPVEDINAAGSSDLYLDTVQ
jgi:hypothetical protein